jgi:hypothetical protein
MSDKLPTPQPSEEVDLGQLFKAIGQLFDRFIKFVTSIFKSIFSVIIYTLKAFIDNWKILSVSIVLAAIVGKVMEKNRQIVYSSNMLVKPYFESKYQLITNLNYYNALLASKDYKTLSTIFQLEKEELEQINFIKIKPGPETENEKLVQYDKYLKTIDSTRAIDVEYDDFIENRSIYSGTFFEIYVESYKKDIFPSIEEGLNKSFTNKYSLKKMAKRDSMIKLQKENLNSSIIEIRRLQKIYIDVLEDESKSSENQIKLGENFSFSTNKTNTKEYDLLNKELKLKNELRALNERQIEEDVFFDTISSFQKVGNQVSDWKEKYSLLFPALVFIFLCFLYLAAKIIKYVNKYKG